MGLCLIKSLEDTVQQSHSIDERKLRTILIVSGLIIWLLSLESILMTKDTQLMQTWLKDQGLLLSPEDFVLLNIISYIHSILMPLIYALYCYIANKRFGLTRLGIALWTLLLGASWILYIIRFDFDSILYYPIVLLMLVLQILNRRVLPSPSEMEARQKEVDQEAIKL